MRKNQSQEVTNIRLVFKFFMQLLFSIVKSGSHPETLDQTLIQGEVDKLANALKVTEQSDILSLFTDLAHIYNNLHQDYQKFFIEIIQE